MHIIAVASQKGGVGKTPISVNLAFALARRPHTKVLLVDTDPQASLTEYLLAEETYEQETTVYNAIMSIEPIAPVEIRERLHLLNAHDELFEAEFRLPSMPNPDADTYMQIIKEKKDVRDEDLEGPFEHVSNPSIRSAILGEDRSYGRGNLQSGR